MTKEELKEYHKKYYVEKNLKEKYKEKKKCDICDILVTRYNWSKHIQTEKHFQNEHRKNNPKPPYVRNRLIKDATENITEDNDPLTVCEEDMDYEKKVSKMIRNSLKIDSDEDF